MEYFCSSSSSGIGRDGDDDAVFNIRCVSNLCVYVCACGRTTNMICIYMYKQIPHSLARLPASTFYTICMRNVSVCVYVCMYVCMRACLRGLQVLFTNISTSLYAGHDL